MTGSISVISAQALLAAITLTYGSAFLGLWLQYRRGRALEPVDSDRVEVVSSTLRSGAAMTGTRALRCRPHARIFAALVLASGSCASFVPHIASFGCPEGQPRYAQRQMPIAYVRRIDGAPGVVTGVVSDATTGESLRGASLEVQPGGYRTTTDSAGTFRLHGVGAGSRTMSARHRGHIEQSTTVHVDAGAGLDIAFQLVAIRCDGISSSATDQVRKPGMIPRTTPPRIP